MFEIVSGSNRASCNSLRIARLLPLPYREQATDVGLLNWL